MSPGYSNSFDNQRGFGENRSLNNDKSFHDINPAAKRSSSRYSSAVTSHSDPANRGKDVKHVNMQLNPDWGMDFDNGNEQLSDEENLKRNIILEKSAPLEVADFLEYNPPTNSGASSEQFSPKCNDNASVEVVIPNIVKDGKRLLESQSAADEQKTAAQPLNHQINGDNNAAGITIQEHNGTVLNNANMISVSSDDVEMKLANVPFGSAKMNFQNGVSRTPHKEGVPNGISCKHEGTNTQNSKPLMVGTTVQIPPNGLPAGDGDMFFGLTKDMRSIATISQKFYEAFGELNNFLQVLSRR